MAKILTVAEALEQVKQKGKNVNSFSKKNFNTLATALVNDNNFKVNVAKKVGGECQLEEVMVTSEFRKWCKKLVEKAGVDSAESEKVLSDDFKINDVTAVVDFMTAAIYEYMNAGNRFDLPDREDFHGGFYLKDVEEKTTTRDAKNPKDGSYIGTFETTKKKHKILAAKSSCPTYLSSKRKIK